MRYRLEVAATGEILRFQDFDERPDDPVGKGWRWVEDPAQPPTRYVRKLLILDRLSDAGLFDAAFAALGGPGEVGYERWQAAAEIAADDAQVRGLLAAIGAGPDVILAPE